MEADEKDVSWWEAEGGWGEDGAYWEFGGVGEGGGEGVPAAGDGAWEGG